MSTIDWIHEQFPATVGNIELALRISELEGCKLKPESVQRACAEMNLSDIAAREKCVALEFELEHANKRIKEVEEKLRKFGCFRCKDSHTPLYCLNCAETLLSR